MTEMALDFWTDETSVLFTSYWGWSPEEWGTVGWSGERGRARMMNLLRQVTDPFITVGYVTSNQTHSDPGLKGKIAGFYLVSHEIGDRDDFIHPVHHDNFPEKWRHSLRALRAFSYLPEHRLSVSDLDPTFLGRARSIAAMGELLTDPEHIRLLRETPCAEVDVYTPVGTRRESAEGDDERGWVKAGPASKDGYEVSQGAHALPRELYVLRLDGDTSAYLGQPANGRAIYKIGLSVSPELRRLTHQKALPRGAFQWVVDRTSRGTGFGYCSSFEAAVAGEDAMKKLLTSDAEWLGGEFYLAGRTEIDAAWRDGLAAAKSYRSES